MPFVSGAAVKKVGELVTATIKTENVVSPFLSNYDRIIKIAYDNQKSADIISIKVYGAGHNTDKFVVIGRNQTDRVNLFRDQLEVNGIHVESINDTYRDASVITPELNDKWINDKIKDGYGVIDIGLDPSYELSGKIQVGDYYSTELKAVENANFGAKGFDSNLEGNPERELK